jgi:hypothetical protein
MVCTLFAHCLYTNSWFNKGDSKKETHKFTNSIPTETIKLIFRTRRDLCRKIITEPDFRSYCLEHSMFFHYVSSTYKYHKDDYEEILAIYYLSCGIPTTLTMDCNDDSREFTQEESLVKNRLKDLIKNKETIFNELQENRNILKSNTIYRRDILELSTMMEEIVDILKIFKVINRDNFIEYKEFV